MRVAFIVLAAALASLPVLADPPKTILQVEVKTLSGKPVERASVGIIFVKGRSAAKFGKKVTTRWEMRTNMQGIAKFPAIPQGKVIVQVNAKGFQTFGQEFELNEEEKTIEVKLNPPQPQYSVHE